MSVRSQLGLLRRRAKRAAYRPVGSALVRAARVAPRPEELERADRQVKILLVSAWGMGGTIRAAHNLAGWLARTNDVEIISAFRRLDEPFFGSFPPGVRVSTLDDQRPEGAAPRGRIARLVRSALIRVPSYFMHPADRAQHSFNLWTDVQLIRRLSGRAGVLIGTRPGLNMLIGRLAVPGFLTIGEEQMHLHHHVKALRRAMPKHYRRLDVLAVLTDHDRAEYAKLLDGGVRLARIPNTVREMGGPKADMESKTVLAAGRLTAQKGFDFLIAAWAEVAPRHPDWRLRICGRGHLEGRLRQQIAEAGLEESISLEGPSDRLEEDMASSSIFVLSSRFEGFPLVLLEAMGKGLGIVAFDCPTGPGDIVDDHENGILVPAQDVAGLAAGINELIEDDALRRRCAVAAVDTAHRYTMEEIGPRWDELLGELRATRARA
jgi:glycosyltransferase involved in cell wall biosynthesis